MSARLTNEIPDLALDRPEKWVLRVLTEAADEHQCVCQRVEDVARAAGYSRRQVQRILARLKQSGVFHPVQRASRYSPAVYRFGLPIVPQKSDWSDWRRVDTATVPPPRCHSPSATATPSGETLIPLRDDKMSPLPQVVISGGSSVLRIALTDLEKEQYRTTSDYKPELGGRSGTRQGDPMSPLDGGRLTDRREVQALIGLFRVTMRPPPQRVSPFEARMLKELAERHGTHLVQAAVVLASRRGGRTVAYVRVLLDRALGEVAAVLREREAAADREAVAASRAFRHRPLETRTTDPPGQRTRVIERRDRYALAIEAGNVMQVIEELADAKRFQYR